MLFTNYRVLALTIHTINLRFQIYRNCGSQSRLCGDGRSSISKAKKIKKMFCDDLVRSPLEVANVVGDSQATVSHYLRKR